MDYINKIKTIAAGTMLAITACGVIATGTADNKVTNTQNNNEVTEMPSSDDGSAPGQYMAVTNVNVNFVQSVTLTFPYNDDKELEDVTNVTNTETLIKTEQSTTVVENDEETPKASAQGNESHQVAGDDYVIDFTAKEYDILCTIVEAEAGDQDEKGRILVANVIFNRVKHESKFDDNIEDVVFAKSGKTYQFSPTKPGGRYYTVTPSEMTIECVERALKGEDYSEGAIYFAMKTPSNSWFNTSLEFLFKHGDHYFYK